MSAQAKEMTLAPRFPPGVEPGVSLPVEIRRLGEKTDVTRFMATIATLWCGLCEAGVGEEAWRKRFVAVYYEQKELHTARANFVSTNDVVHPFFNADIRQWVMIYLCPPAMLGTRAFLFHSSCLGFLRQVSKTKLSKYALFRLGQVLLCESPPWRYNIPKQLVFHPLHHVVKNSIVRRYRARSPKDHAKVAQPLRFPPEIMLRILFYLPPRTLINFFRASPETYTYVELFCKVFPWRFFPSLADIKSVVHSAPTLVSYIHYKWSDRQYAALEKRWNMVADTAELAQYVSQLPEVAPDYATVRISRKTSDHPATFGFHEIIDELPEKIPSVQVYARMLSGRYYVCGIKWRSTAHGDKLMGDDQSHARTELFLPDGRCDIIRFIRDFLGIRSVGFGGSAWAFGGLEELGEWEGLSLRSNPRIHIVTDGLKFRHIGWHMSGGLPLSESLVMNNPYFCRFDLVSETGQFFQKDVYVNNSVAFSERVSDHIYFPGDMTGITMYFDQEDYEIAGIRVHSPTWTELKGQERPLSQHFKIHGPGEVISDILGRVRTSSRGLALLYLFGSVAHTSNFPMISLGGRCSESIAGIVFQFNSNLKIEKFGVINAISVRGTLNPVFHPELTISDNGLSHIYENGAPKLETRGLLFGISHVCIYHLRNTCVGMELFYRCGRSDLVGRSRGRWCHQISFAKDEQVTGLKVSYRKRSGQRVVGNIELETNKTPQLNLNHARIQSSDMVGIAWWYDAQKDYVRLFSVRTGIVIPELMPSTW
ncbi:hypothetical protein VTO42DRAFT_2469 [Malbranchea cinnamomea]